MEIEESKMIAMSKHVPLFDGDPKNYPVWWRCFRGYAGINKFKEAISEVRDPNMPESEATVLDLSTEQGKKQARAVGQNANAIHNLNNAFMTRSLGILISAACSEEWPDGKAYKVIKALKDKYQ